MLTPPLGLLMCPPALHPNRPQSGDTPPAGPSHEQYSKTHVGRQERGLDPTFQSIARFRLTTIFRCASSGQVPHVAQTNKATNVCNHTHDHDRQLTANGSRAMTAYTCLRTRFGRFPLVRMWSHNDPVPQDWSALRPGRARPGGRVALVVPGGIGRIGIPRGPGTPTTNIPEARSSRWRATCVV